MKAEDRHDGLENDAYVEPDRPAASIVAVEGDATLVADAIAPAHLPKPAQARTRLEALLEITTVVMDLVVNDRPRSDQAHVTTQHVEQLRKLIKTRLAQDLCDVAHPRIIAKLARALPFRSGVRVGSQVPIEHLVAVRDHGSKLVADEPRASDADTPMHEDDRSTHKKSD